MGPKCVRIVDDAVELARLLRLQLELEGIAVTTTTREFDRLLRPEPWNDVDAAVVDLMLPGISGVDILSYLRDNHPHIRRVAMTASLGGAPVAIGVAHATLVKPFPTAEIVRVLDG